MADNFRFAQLQPFTLAGAGAIIGDTTIVLKSMTDIDGTAIVFATVFGDVGYATIQPGEGTSEEQISFTGITQNANGTATLTGVKSVTFTYPYTETSGLLKTHPGSTSLIISNTSGFYNKLTSKDSDETINGLWTFTQLPESTAGNATTGNQLITYAQALALATGTASIDRTVVAGNGGETITIGQLVYLKVSDGEWYKCDADTASTVDNIILGIAQGAGSDGVAITNGILLFGLDTNQTGLTNNSTYYASNTAGGISLTPGTTEVTVGVSRSITSILFFPRYNQVLTEDQQDLIEKIQLGTDFYGASSAGSDTYAITITPSVAYTNGIRFRFKADVANTGAATLNVNGLGAITIKKAHDQDLITGDIEANQIVEVIYNSTGPVFEMISQTALVNSTDVQIFTADGTWTKPSGAKSVLVQAWGAGGGGAGGAASTGGGGGGGGAYMQYTFDANDLSATEDVVVGVGAAATAGENSTFGTTKVIAYGGGAGKSSANQGGGGGGAGQGSIGIDGVTGTGVGGAGGSFSGGAGGAPGAVSLLGGGGGGSAGNTGSAGGLTVYGGGGGGGGATNAGAPGNGGAGASSLYGGGGGGGGGGTGGGAAGTSTYGGAGGAGVTGTNNGNAGSIPAGGGGGGAGAASSGGAGARGEVIVTTYF